MRVPHEAVVGVAMIVGQDQDDIRWLGFSSVKHDSAEQDGDQGFDERFHSSEKWKKTDRIGSDIVLSCVKSQLDGNPAATLET